MWHRPDNKSTEPPAIIVLFILVMWHRPDNKSMEPLNIEFP